MLSATPHDGKPESFASLIDILDPTVLPDKSHYTVDDFKDKGLVIRRFKADIKDQVASAFQMRDIDTIDAGVPVLSMHAPFETVSKLDCFMTYKGIKAFYEAK